MKNTIDGDFQSTFTPTSTNHHNDNNNNTGAMPSLPIPSIPSIPKERKSRVQVCVRVRPIIQKNAIHFQDKDNSKGSSSGR